MQATLKIITVSTCNAINVGLITWINPWGKTYI